MGGASREGGTESLLGAYCVQQPTYLSGAMSWTCPRCQQPVFFGEARAEEREKTGRVCAAGFLEDTRNRRGCNPRPRSICGAGTLAGWSWPPGDTPHGLPEAGWGAGGKEGDWQPSSTLFPTAEKVSSLGKNWHRFCLKCEHCHSVLSPGGHAEVRPSWGTQPYVCHCPPGTSPNVALLAHQRQLQCQLPKPLTGWAPHQP